jgi:hypothetical protein
LPTFPTLLKHCDPTGNLILLRRTYDHIMEGKVI